MSSSVAAPASAARSDPRDKPPLPSPLLSLPLPAEGFVNKAQVKAYLNVRSDDTLWRMIAQNRCPEPDRRLGFHRRWDVEKLRAFYADPTKRKRGRPRKTDAKK